MPCRSDYLEPNERERELQRASKLLVFVYKKLKKPCPKWVKEQAKDIYARDDRVVPMLCEAVTKMTDRERERIVYDAHNPASRDLADWWERHQKADRERLAKEKAERKQKRLRKQAKGKLTIEERKALGL